MNPASINLVRVTQHSLAHIRPERHATQCLQGLQLLLLQRQEHESHCTVLRSCRRVLLSGVSCCPACPAVLATFAAACCLCLCPAGAATMPLLWGQSDRTCRTHNTQQEQQQPQTAATTQQQSEGRCMHPGRQQASALVQHTAHTCC